MPQKWVLKFNLVAFSNRHSYKTTTCYIMFFGKKKEEIRQYAANKHLTKGWVSNKNNSSLINLPKIFDSQSCKI
jgi:hypothetical protein